MYYFIGIKGTGMAALALMLKGLGYEVAGSDIDKPLFTEQALRDQGIKIYPFNPDNLQDNYQVIIGNAFGLDHPEVKAALANPTIKHFYYHEFLGQLMQNYETVAVAGTHGKTTTTALLAAVLAPYFPTGYLIGDGSGQLDATTTQLIVEACEFKRHFLAYQPDIAIITNIGYDHVDYYPTQAEYNAAFQEFAEQVSTALVVYGDSETTQQLDYDRELLYYGLKPTNDIQAINIDEGPNGMEFDVIWQGEYFGHFALPFVGSHQLLNSLAVITVAHLKGLSASEIAVGFNNYHGVKRRFVIEQVKDSIFIDDYAHHPTEIGVTLQAARIKYPQEKIVAVYKPHRASRIFHFATLFKAAFHLADEIILCPFNSIDDYETDISIDVHYLAERLPNAVVVSEDEIGAKYIASRAPACFVFMSDKDIYYLASLVKMYL